MKSDWFVNARFGLFLHWGLYSIASKGCWGRATEKWMPGEYESLMKKFNPVDYDPALWAKLAKAAGMKYAVLTTRHHDGFCMFDSRFTDYKVTKAPYGKDVTRMFAEAFRAEGLKVGFYHSMPDWTHPGFADQESPEFHETGKVHTPTPEQHRAFLDLLYNHVEQLMTEYGKIDLLFLDYTSKYKADEDYYERDHLLDMIYRHQPEIIVNDRLSFFKDNVRDFDYYTPEICIPNWQPLVKGKPVIWETCTTMNDHWGYCENDVNFKPLQTLTAGLIGCVGQNGNLLLNVGPDPRGCFPVASVERLKGLAQWYHDNGEAVVGCGKAEYTPPFGCSYTQKGKNLYCYLLIQPMGDIILPGLKDKIEYVTLLRTHETVKMVGFWGFELLQKDELRIRPVNVRAGDVLKIVLK